MLVNARTTPKHPKNYQPYFLPLNAFGFSLNCFLSHAAIFFAVTFTKAVLWPLSTLRGRLN